MDGTPNICAGPFGTVYDVDIEHPWLMRAIGRMVWGIDASVLYTSMAPIGTARDVTILDVPCGGGVAFRALRPEQQVRYIAGRDPAPEDAQAVSTACPQAIAGPGRVRDSGHDGAADGQR